MPISKDLTVLTDTGFAEFENSDFRATEAGLLGIIQEGDDTFHTVLAPGQWLSATKYTENEYLSEFGEIAAFMQEGGQEVPETPSWYPDSKDLFRFLDRVRDEVAETFAGIQDKDLPEIVDGFLDIAYVAITGAIRAAGTDAAQACWDEILDANTAKIDGRYGETVRDEKTGKILKPEGWVAPNIAGVLREHTER